MLNCINFARVTFHSLCLLSTWGFSNCRTRFDIGLDCLALFHFVSFRTMCVSHFANRFNCNGQKTIEILMCVRKMQCNFTQCVHNYQYIYIYMIYIYISKCMYICFLLLRCVYTTKQLNQNGWDIISFIWFAFMLNACFMLNVCFSSTIFGATEIERETDKIKLSIAQV